MNEESEWADLSWTVSHGVKSAFHSLMKCRDSYWICYQEGHTFISLPANVFRAEIEHRKS